MIPIPRRYWVMGTAAALAVHVAIAAAVYWRAPEPGARDAGRGGIQVSLGPAGGSPGEAVEVDGTPEVETVRPETAEEQAVTEVDEAVPVESDSAQVETVEPASMTTTATVETVQTQTDPSVPARQTPEPAQQPEPAEPADESEPETAEASAASLAGAGERAGSGETANAGSGESAAGGGKPGVSPDYMAQLRAWLEKHKRYPRRARLRRQEGTAMLSFVVDREGRVVEYSIRESSGHRILDEEVVAMIERAQPLPGFPDDMQRSRLALVVPVQFFLM